MVFYFYQNSAICHQMEGAVIVYFADDMYLVTGDILRYLNGNDRGF